MLEGEYSFSKNLHAQRHEAHDILQKYPVALCEFFKQIQLT